MTEFKYLKELLSTATGTEGLLLIPKKIYDALIDEAEKVLIPRSEAAYIITGAAIPGSSIDLNLITPNTLKIRVIGEGASAPIDQVAYTSLNFKPVKYGVSLRITREMLEDAQWNLLENNLRIIGRRFAENETNLIITALDNAGNTVAGGAAITIANITRAMQYLEDSDYTPTTLFIGQEVLNDLRNIDTFVEASRVGNTEMLTKGFLGNIYGLNCLRFSTNAAPSSAYSKYAYVTDKNHAYAIVEKRPITVERFEMPVYDMSAAVCTQRIVVGYVRTSAIAKITTA